jgi:predicted MPP superfamily phosphohydrolase
MTSFRLTLWVIMAIAQFTAWHYWQRRIKNIFLGSVVKSVYLLVNVVTAAALAHLYILTLIPPEHVIWTYLYRPVLTWQFAHLMWFALSLVIWVGAFLWRRWLYRTPRGLPSLFRAPKSGITAFHLVFLAWLGFLAVCFYGYSVQLEPAEVKRYSVSSADLPPELEGMRIVHLSDFHYGLGMDQTELTQRLSQAASLRPDLVIITGDMVDTHSGLAREWRDPLKLLGGVPHGIYGVLGNHDLYTLNPTEETMIFQNYGVNILRNETKNVEDLPLTIVGFDDPGTRSVFFRPDPAASTLDFTAIKDYPPPQGNFVILVRHRPQGLATAAKEGIPLYLAGHTHGGQVQTPWNSRWNLMSLSADYTEGSYFENPTTLIISNGLAAAGLPFRLWAWPEIGLITLTRKVGN